jgi:hypothetical protein
MVKLFLQETRETRLALRRSNGMSDGGTMQARGNIPDSVFFAMNRLRPDFFTCKKDDPRQLQKNMELFYRLMPEARIARATPKR